MKHTSPKICFYNGVSCNEFYKSCEDYNSADTTCISIKPLTEINAGIEIFNRDYLHKCVGESNKCITEHKIFSDFNIQEDQESLCPSLKTEIDSSWIKAKWTLQKESCYDVYLNCENYNVLERDSTKRNQNVCTSILAKTKTNGFDE